MSGAFSLTHVGLRDSAENMKKALNGSLETLIVGIRWLIHLLQLCLKENLLNLPSVKAMVEKFRRASQLENQSQAFHNEFHKQQKVLNPALVVDCTICGFFRYFRSNKPKGGRTIARTNSTKNEFL